MLNKPPKKIYITQPFLPPLEEFTPYLEKIWEEKWLTNNRIAFVKYKSVNQK